jgi:TolB protein
MNRTVFAAALLAGLLAAGPAQATFPGKNGAIAYSFFPGASNSGSANFEIVTILPGEDPMALLPQRPRKDNWPDWSPDGNRIVWWYSAGGGNVDTYVMNADGSGQTNLTSDNTGLDWGAAFSPDGHEIVLESDYNSGTGATEIQVIDTAGNRLRQLTHSGGLDALPQFSPDGKRIAFIHASTPAFEDGAIYTMDANDGGNVVKVTPDGMNAAIPDWSPDGKRLVFVEFCHPCDTQDISVVNADGSNPRRLTNTPSEAEFRAGFSPDGKKITFSSIPLTAEHPFGDLPADVYVMNANGTGRRNITNSPDFQDRAPDWGPKTHAGE